MQKLYPPFIEGKLPACAGNALVIPFIMNKAVSENQISGMAAIIKTISTGRIVATLTKGTLMTSDKGYMASFDNEKENGQITKLVNGQYYKVQLAYITRRGTIGYYSSVGTFKRTTIPKVTVPALEGNFYAGYHYTGLYSQEGLDDTEKIYSYCFELSDMDGNIVDTSGIKVHNSENDISNKYSEDSWKSIIELNKDVPYYLTYKITTMNGLEVSSPRYITMNQDSIDIDLDIQLTSKMNIDDGCVQLYLSSTKETGTVVSGSFVLVRASSKDNFGAWDEVYKFAYLNTSVSQDIPMLIWEDCTVEQGEEYLYAIQAFNSRNLYSNRLTAKNGAIKVDFIDAFLYDGKRQLKIQFNPKISSLKETVLETKMDTIGSQYPFILRNGYVQYKELAIQGLLSLLSDDSGRFMNCKTCASRDACPSSYKNKRCEKYNQLQENEKRLITPSQSNSISEGSRSNVSADNIYNERQFKLEVLEWLNNGEPKIFRSPTEGNYIVRIMNTSLTPMDTLSRMLHTFKCSAYQIADWSFKNLVDLKLIELPVDKLTNLKIAQIQPKPMIGLYHQNLNEFQNQYPIFNIYNDLDIGFTGVQALGLNITEATPGTVLQFAFASGSNPSTIEIGGTGCYYVQTREIGITGIQLISGSWDEMKITFEYYNNDPTDTFSHIASLTLTDEIRRFIGPGYGLNIPKPQAYANSNNIISDIRREIGSFHYIKVEKRYIQEVWPVNVDGVIRYARHKAGVDFIGANEWNPTVIYYNHQNGRYYSGNMDTIMTGEPDYRFRLNSAHENIYVDLGPRALDDPEPHNGFGNSFGRIDAIRNVGKVEALQIGNGLIADVAYRVRTKEYVIENDGETGQAKRDWEESNQEIRNAIARHESVENIQQIIDISNVKYSTFIEKLKVDLERRGILV